MFSLKPPRPTFRSYLLPPPQVNNPLLGASGEAPRVPGSPGPQPRGCRSPSGGKRTFSGAPTGSVETWATSPQPFSAPRPVLPSLCVETQGSERLGLGLCSSAPGSRPRGGRQLACMARGHPVEGVTCPECEHLGAAQAVCMLLLDFQSTMNRSLIKDLVKHVKDFKGAGEIGVCCVCVIT